jgi:hypothetical protein
MRSPPFQKDFLADLRALHAVQEQGSEHFFVDLERVCALHPGKVDGGHAYTPGRGPDLSELGPILSELRRRASHRALDAAKLPENDPLRCPVSLFGTMDQGRMEKAHTQALTWLMAPNEGHGFGSSLLSAFLNAASAGHLVDGITVDEIAAEKPFSTGKGRKKVGFLDSFARGDYASPSGRRTWVLVIEAKIDAGLRDRQLDKIEEWVQREHAGADRLLVFLTSDGAVPEQHSRSWIPGSSAESVGV